MSPQRNGKMNLFLLTPSIHMKQKVAAIKKTGKGHNIIYVTVTSSCEKLTPLLRNGGVTQELFFVGCGRFEHHKTHTDCIHCLSPNALIALSLLIIGAAKRMPGRKLVVFDSVSSLLMYHDSNTTLRFISFLAKQLREMSVDSLFLVLGTDMKMNENKRLMLLADEVKE